MHADPLLRVCWQLAWQAGLFLLPLFVDPRWCRWSVLSVWTVPSHCVRPSCLSILVHLTLVGTVEGHVEGQRGTNLIPFVNLRNILQSNTKVVKRARHGHTLYEVNEKNTASTLVAEQCCDTRVGAS